MRVFLFQDSDINCSDAMRVLCIWRDSDINGSDAMCVFIAGQRYQCSDAMRFLCIFGGKAILMVAMQCAFFMAGQRYQRQRSKASFVYFGSGQRYLW